MKLRFYGVAIFFFIVVAVNGQEVTLQEAVQKGLQANFDVRILDKSSDIAANDYRFSYGAFLPTLNANGQYIQNTNTSTNINFAGVEKVVPTAISTNTNASVQLVWTLFDGTKMFATRKRLEELAALGEINVRNQMMNSTASIVTTYFNIIRQKQQLKAIQELMKVSEERVKLAEKKLQVGTGGKPELLQAKVDMNAQRTAILSQQTVIQQLKDQMNGLLGMTLPEQYDVADSIPIDLSLRKEDILTDIENTNQTLVANRKSIDIAKQILKENRAGRSPIINFVGSYNIINRTENQVEVTPGVTQKLIQNQGFNYGLQVAIPILNGMNINRLVNQAKLNLDRQTLIYDQQVMIAVVGVRNAFINYDNAKQTLIINEENILLARENVYIALEGFKRGIITALDLRTAQQSLADAYNLLIAARYNAKVSETELFRLKGALLK